MDESHRLKPMVSNYDQELFNELYKQTKDLRKKLAWGIDSRKFGVDYFEVLSWFDVKFIYAFNKYYNDPRCKDSRTQVLKGFIINALTMFSRRIIVESYKPKQTLNDTLDITTIFDYENLKTEETKIEEGNSLFNILNTYIKDRLSSDAYFLFNLELNPPPYILSRLSNSKQKKIPKPSVELLSEYLGIEENDGAETYIKALRKEIEDIKKQAREYFLMIDIKELVLQST